MDHIAKRQKVDEKAVLFNSDTLSKIISYLPSIDLLNLALASKRFGISDNNDDPSLIETSAQILVQDIATEEQLAALPHYDGESSLADYHYLQLMKAPLVFDQLVGAKYINREDKSCVCNPWGAGWMTALSYNIMRAGKHYTLFTPLGDDKNLQVGVMRPGQANENARGSPCHKEFFQHFSRTHVERYNNSSVHCCMYNHYGKCNSSGWHGSDFVNQRWEGMESTTSGDDIGMLLDLDEGTLSVYKNGRKLGVMKRGLAGPYCWVISLYERAQFRIKRGSIPPS